MQRIAIGIAFAAICSSSYTPCSGGPFAPAAGEPGSTAVPADDPSIAGWASAVIEIVRGPVNLADSSLGLASFGSAAAALGPADASGRDPTPVVSLGNGGYATLTFDHAVRNGPGADLVVFENGFGDQFLELALVEVSSNGIDFFTFPAESLTQTAVQVGSFDPLDPTDLANLAGKYRVGFGTPFDLAVLAGTSALLDVDGIVQVRIRDVVGSLDPNFQVLDSQGRPINDPWPTPFASSGFDLDAVGARYLVPEPSAGLLMAAAAMLVLIAAGRCTSARRA